MFVKFRDSAQLNQSWTREKLQTSTLATESYEKLVTSTISLQKAKSNSESFSREPPKLYLKTLQSQIYRTWDNSLEVYPVFGKQKQLSEPLFRLAGLLITTQKGFDVGMNGKAQHRVSGRKTKTDKTRLHH